MSTNLEVLIINYPNGYREGEGWDVIELSANPSITMEFIRANIEGVMVKTDQGLELREWNYHVMSRRADFDQSLMRELPDKDWDHCSLHRRPDLDQSLIGDFPDMRWIYGLISKRRDLDWSLVRDFPGKNWDCSRLMWRSDLDWSLVRDFPDKNWDYQHLSRRTDFDHSLLDALPDKFRGLIIRNATYGEIDIDKMTVSQLSSMRCVNGVTRSKTKSARSV